MILSLLLFLPKMTSLMHFIIMKHNHDSSGTRSEKNINYLDLPDKDCFLYRRKISETYYEPCQRQNFVYTHRADHFDVQRLYIDSLYSPTVRLYYTKFTPKNKEITLCVVHGYGQSTDNFIEMAQYFAKNGFVVNMIDLRGFGYSGGARAFESFRGLLSDIENLLRRCCQKGLPTYLMGHGFGSLLILALLEQNPDLPLSGVICLSPLFRFPCFKDTSLLGKIIITGLSKIWPYLQINNQLNPTALTNNPLKIKECFDGVFNYQFMSINMANAHSQLSQKVLKDAEKFKYPLLLLYGAKDSVQRIDEVKKFYRYVGSKQKFSYVFKNGFHHLYSDQNAEREVFPKIVEWVFDLGSNKGQVKWSVTGPFKLSVIKTVPNAIKYVVMALIPIVVAVILKIRSIVRKRL